ncbi:MAG: SDR family oxidoreductase [Bacteroidetes bacterium]|nr:SDR family oxidoreductase [Bacteroidota bacterium]
MKVILTGSKGGIGSAILNELKQKSIDVVEINSSEIDFSKDFDIHSVPVDGLVYCAGINHVNAYDEIDEQQMIDVMNVNTFGFIRLCKKIQFNEGSNVIAIGSLYSTETKAGRLSYTMSKHAMYGAVKTLALEMAYNKVKVNMVSPGFVDTPLTRKNNTDERIQQLNNSIPLGLTSASEIGKVCVYLMTSNNAITGQNIIVDGGYSLVGV